MTLETRMMRHGAALNDDKRDAGLMTPGDVKRVDDIKYGPARENVLDVYYPKNGNEPYPVIISVHGGGWVYGDKERYQYYCMDLAKRGFAVVNFTYRLAPESKYPAQMEDVVSVFEWVFEKAGEYKFDLGNLFAVGDSAGAHLLSLYCAKYAEKGRLPKAVALNCGVYDMEAAFKANRSMKDLMKDLLPGKGTAEEIAEINPLNFIKENFPPCFVMTATDDFLKPQAPLLTTKLDSLGVSYKYKLYSDEETPLGHVFHLDIRSRSGKLCNDEECEFFKGFIN